MNCLMSEKERKRKIHLRLFFYEAKILQFAGPPNEPAFHQGKPAPLLPKRKKNKNKNKTTVDISETSKCNYLPI